MAPSDNHSLDDRLDRIDARLRAIEIATEVQTRAVDDLRSRWKWVVGAVTGLLGLVITGLITWLIQR